MFFLVRICQMLQKETIILQIQIKQKDSKGLSKSVVAIGSSSHRGHVILERKKSGSDPGSFITL
jgi:hypothetical protein